MSAENRNDDLFQNLRQGFEGFSKKVGSLVDDVFNAEETGGELRVRTDVYLTTDQYVVEVELPGVRKEDVTIQVQDGVLHIQGRKLPAEGSAQFNYERRERTYGGFAKEITLPTTVELENIKAKYEAGVLIVRFPRQPEPDQGGNVTID